MNEDKGEKISKGLRRTKAKGVIIGNPKLSEVRNSDLTSANQVRARNAQRFALGMIGILWEIFLKGFRADTEVVDELNRRNIPARRGGIWRPPQLAQLYKILKKIDPEKKELAMEEWKGNHPEN